MLYIKLKVSISVIIIGEGKGKCTPSDHAHILYTGGFEGEEFNKKDFMHGSITVPEIFAVKITKFP